MIVQNGQHHVSAASQIWYMSCMLHCDANAVLCCFAASSQSEVAKEVPQSRQLQYDFEDTQGLRQAAQDSS